MRSEIENGGPAFPTADSETKVNESGYPTVTVAASHQGMSLRDWFAGQAITGLTTRCLTKDDWQRLPFTCYEVADAMIALRALSHKEPT